MSALTDEELGETNLVTHSINTGDAKPVKTLPLQIAICVMEGDGGRNEQVNEYRVY